MIATRRCDLSSFRVWFIFGFLLSFSPPPSVGAAASDPLVRLETVVGGLRSPVFVTHAGDASGRLFVLEQAGRIRIVKNGRLLAAPFLDITARVDFAGEKGLLGLAFHPSFKANGRFFVNYTTRTAGPLRTVIAEYRVSASDPDTADATETLILEFNQPFDNHNGGMVAFGPDGYLYIGAGDGGSGGDPQNNGQRLATLLGKVLRIDVDSASPYAIPADNPFVDRTGARGEIWAYGLRNPWRFSFDRLTGRLFLGDVGQNSVEEVDLIERGANYGWRIMEGSRCFSPASGCNRAGLILPITDYRNPTDGISVTGGYVYRGPQVTSLRGAYIFGDFGSSRIWSLVEQSAGIWKRSELLKPGFGISSFGEDEQGEVYVVDYETVNGSVRRLLFGSTQVFPQVPDGGGYTTTFTVNNTSLNASQVTLRFFNSDGTPRQVTLSGMGPGNSFTFEVPAGGTRTLSTFGIGPVATTGAALLESTPTAPAVAAFRLSSATRPLALAAVPDSAPASHFTVPVRTAAGADTAVAVANPGDAPINAHVVLVDRDGLAVESLDLPQLNPLPPKGQVALFVTQMGFRNPSALAEGSLQILIQSPGEASVTALILDGGLLSVVPVISGGNQ